MTSHSLAIFPEIILLDFSLAIAGAVFDSFNKINLLYYLDECHEILKEESEECFNTTYVICSGHLIRVMKRFIQSAVGCCKNKTLQFL